MVAGTVLSRLDRETGGFHAHVDRGWCHLLHDPSATREDYAHQLVASYGFEGPFEAACAYTPGLSQVVDLRGRARSGLIAQDLLALRLSPEQVTNLRCFQRPPFQDAVEALAWMYVVERPALVYDDIRKRLTSRFVDLTRACTYLRAYEGVATKQWAELGRALDDVCTSSDICDRLLKSVVEASEAIVEWQRTAAPGLRIVG